MMDSNKTECNVDVFSDLLGGLKTVDKTTLSSTLELFDLKKFKVQRRSSVTNN